MVPQTEQITSPIHHQKGLYFYHIKYYAVLKECYQVLHKLQPKGFQGALDKLSVLNFPLVEIEKSFPIRFVLCTDTEIVSIQKKKDTAKVQVKNLL